MSSHNLSNDAVYTRKCKNSYGEPSCAFCAFNRIDWDKRGSGFLILPNNFSYKQILAILTDHMVTLGLKIIWKTILHCVG